MHSSQYAVCSMQCRAQRRGRGQPFRRTYFTEHQNSSQYAVHKYAVQSSRPGRRDAFCAPIVLGVAYSTGLPRTHSSFGRRKIAGRCSPVIRSYRSQT